MTRFGITGGAGFLGINLVRYLLNRGHEVVSIDIVPFDYPEKDKIIEKKVDIRDLDALKQAFQGLDVVIHTAAALPLYKPKDIYSTDIVGTTNVLNAARDVGVGRVIHISSTAVYGIPDHHPLYESDKLEGVGPYGESKVRAESICQEFRDDGFCVPIIRPKSFIGPERLGVFALLYDWAFTGHHFPMIGSGNNRYQLLDVEDLCDAIYETAMRPCDEVNDTFNIGAKEFGTMKEDYQSVLDAAGFGKKVLGFPATPMIWTLRFLEMLRISPLYKWVYETASKDSFVSIEKAERILDYKPKYSNKQALVRNYEWYIAHIDDFKGKSGVSHRVPWKQGILGVAKIFFKNPYRIVKYLFTGLIGISTNLTVTWLMNEVVHAHYLNSSISGLAVSMLVGFLLQKYWTFEENDHSRAPMQFIFYISAAFLNLAINTFIVFGLVSGFHVHYLVAQFIGAGIIAIDSFFVYTFLIFRSNSK